MNQRRARVTYDSQVSLFKTASWSSSPFLLLIFTIFIPRIIVEVIAVVAKQLKPLISIIGINRRPKWIIIIIIVIIVIIVHAEVSSQVNPLLEDLDEVDKVAVLTAQRIVQEIVTVKVVILVGVKRVVGKVTPTTSVPLECSFMDWEWVTK